MEARSGGAEGLMHCFGGAFAGKRVLVTGHTGFKGAWLCHWLELLGAQVIGYALAPEPGSMFLQLETARHLQHHMGDIRDLAKLREVITESRPDVVFHLAAQALVRASYERPLETHEVNVLGTAHVLECLRTLKQPCAGVMVTTDKCYENQEWLYGYRESDPLGGHDPYSASKAAAEILISSYRRSFFQSHPVKVASARAGNVIGGGDWAQDRIVPDCMRALAAGQPIAVRNRHASRPWQHVLEPLSGYLWLAASLLQPASNDHAVAIRSAFNFGPAKASNRSVGELVEEILKHRVGEWEDRTDPNALHEAKLLHLVTDKAHALLGWQPVWDFAQTIRETVRWYAAAEIDAAPDALRALTCEQIEGYVRSAEMHGLPWAKASSEAAV